MNSVLLAIFLAGLVSGCNEELPTPPIPPVVVRHTIVKKARAQVEAQSLASDPVDIEPARLEPVVPQTKTGKAVLRAFRQEEKAAAEARSYPNATPAQIRAINESEKAAYEATQNVISKDGSFTPEDEMAAHQALDAMHDARIAPLATVPLPPPAEELIPLIPSPGQARPPPIAPSAPSPAPTPSRSAPLPRPPPEPPAASPQASPPGPPPGSPTNPKPPSSPPRPPEPQQPLPGAAFLLDAPTPHAIAVPSSP
jgi:hypothetical protein